MSERKRPRPHRHRGRGLWLTARCECVCGHEWVAVFGPLPPDEARAYESGEREIDCECPRCGTMGGRIRRDE